MSFFCALKNHFKNDHLCDWLELHQNRYQKDKPSQFHINLMKEKKEYLKSITDIFCFKYSNYVLRNQDQNKIQYHIENNNKYIFLNSTLYSKKYQMYVRPDIIIHKDIFKEIFYEIDDTELPNYIILDVLYNIVSYNSDKSDLLNNGNMIYYKCKISLAIDCLKEYIDYKYGYFLAKEYRHKDIVLPKKKTIGKFPIYDEYYEDIHEGIQWLKRLKKNYKQWSLYPEPTVIELYPNMNCKESEWFSEKCKIATEIKEITMIWNISYEKRNQFILEKGITKWDNPILSSNFELKHHLPSEIKNKIIQINNQDIIDITPRNIKNSELLSYFNQKNQIVLDIESVVHLDENQSYFDQINNHDKPKICIIGMIHSKNNESIFKDFTISQLTNKEEGKIIQYWVNYIRNIFNNEKIYIYHWGNAEKIYINYMKNKYPEIKFPEIKLIDLCFYFKQIPIVIRGCFGYGLKEIANKLYELNKIKTIWDEDMNGLDAMYYLLHYSMKASAENIPLKRYSEIRKIIDYNKVDCQVVYEIVDFLKL